VLHSDGLRSIRVSMLGYVYDAMVLDEHRHQLLEILRRSPAMRSRTEKVGAPMPGLIKSVLTSNGAVVTKGETLFTLEAMKMENALVAPIDGTISDLHIDAGSAVEKGETLCLIHPHG
jgi:biotin carboxyl carrier protein